LLEKHRALTGRNAHAKIFLMSRLVNLLVHGTYLD